MANLISVVGSPASGKSYSLKDLNPDETIIINSDLKKYGPTLDFNKKFNSEKKNIFNTDDMDKVKAIMVGISEKKPEIKVLVIDTLNAVLETYMHGLRRQKTFDKWSNLASDTYDIMKLASGLRDDLTVVILVHSETYKCVNANGDEGLCERMNIPGSKLTRDQTINKLLSFNFYSKVLKGEDGKTQYVFQTESDGTNDARSVEGLFDSVYIPNDISFVIKTINEKLG